MGDWVNIRFRLKPTLVDARFLKKMDACFARMGYRPSKMWVPQLPANNNQVDPGDRLAAMGRAKFFNTYEEPREGLASAYLGYSVFGALDETNVHVEFPIWQTCRYVDKIELRPHADSMYFSPASDYALYLSEEEKRGADFEIGRAELARRVTPVIHKEFDAYYSEAKRSHVPEPMFFTGKEHSIPFFDGINKELWFLTAELYQDQDGKWICPVCKEARFEKPPWFLADNLETSRAQPSPQKCPTCQTQYGVDDNILVFPACNQITLWNRLQRKWLKQREEAKQPKPAP
jgi:hypothetical protein